MKTKKIFLVLSAVLFISILAYITAKNVYDRQIDSSKEHKGHSDADSTDSCDHTSDSRQEHLHQEQEHNHQQERRHAVHTDNAAESRDTETATFVELTDKQIEQIGLETASAEGGTLNTDLILNGEIKINTDKAAHIVPRVSGVVSEVKKSLGDKVESGEVVATIESRELADIKSQYLSAQERKKMARIAFEREKKLWEGQISSQQEYLETKEKLVEAEITYNSAAEKLLAIGFDRSHLSSLGEQPENTLTRFEIKAPFSGDVIEKYIVMGEMVSSEKTVLVIADMKTVWVDLQVYPQDIKHIKKGMEIEISIDSQAPAVKGIISYIGAVASEQTRTVTARATTDNPGMLKPGLFVTAKTTVSAIDANITVPQEAIQTIDGRKAVFIKEKNGFEVSYVETGIKSEGKVQIISGLDKNQRYVSSGAFALKSKIVTSTLDSHAGHGH